VYARRCQATEAEYQCKVAGERATELRRSNEAKAGERDLLEALVLKLKLYTLGGASAVKSGRPPHTTLPPRLVATLDRHERQCLDDIFGHFG